jgi:hypothetical protein
LEKIKTFLKNLQYSIQRFIPKKVIKSLYVFIYDKYFKNIYKNIQQGAYFTLDYQESVVNLSTIFEIILLINNKILILLIEILLNVINLVIYKKNINKTKTVKLWSSFGCYSCWCCTCSYTNAASAAFLSFDRSFLNCLLSYQRIYPMLNLQEYKLSKSL